jgi:Putative rhamnosyl transferase
LAVISREISNWGRDGIPLDQSLRGDVRVFFWLQSISAEQKAFVNGEILQVAMTRFNLPLAGTHFADAVARRGYEAWCAHRVDVFRAVCLPTMLKQQVKPQAWILLLNERSTPAVDRLVAELAAHEWIVPLPLGADWAERLPGESSRVLQERFGSIDPAYVCCTRLDNDDSVHRRYHAVLDAVIARLRKQAPLSVPLCLNFPYGVMQYEGRLLVRLKEKHFFGLVEAFDDFRTPYQVEHTKIDGIAPVLDVFTERPMWIHHRHGENASGDTRQASSFEEFANPARVLRNFGLTAVPGVAIAGAANA